MNSELIKGEMGKVERLERLTGVAQDQLRVLNETNDILQSVKRLDETTYLTAGEDAPKN